MINGMTAKTTRARKPDPEMRDIAGISAQMRANELAYAALADKREERVKYYHSLNVSCASMARAMGISEAAVSKILYGKRKRSTPSKDRG